ncbi:MAG: hypothetical protein REI94_00880 [Moraxellaceae bacterium]|nr:hypothetical protein [Moraxellaceae bacterium]
MSLVLCYLLPVLLLGTLFLGIEGGNSQMLHFLLLVTLPPLLGGFSISLFVADRPQLHVLLATSGWLIFMRIKSESLVLELVAAVAVYAVAFSGCYIGKRLRPRLRKPQPPTI